MNFETQNTATNISGRAKIERFVSGEIWNREIQPAVEKALGSKSFKARARIGKWAVEAVGDDPHIHEFFSLNWFQEKGSGAEVRSWYLSSCADSALLKTFLGIHSDSEWDAHRNQVLENLKDPGFRILVRDEKILNIENLPDEKQKQASLSVPAFIYCPELKTSLSLNSSYYGQFKSKSVLGPLEEYLTELGELDEAGAVANPEEVWISMHAGCAQYVTGKGENKGVVLVGPTGTAKSTHAYGLASAKPENKMHSDDWLFVNAGTGEVLAAENSFYMRTPMAEFYPELTPVFLTQPLENVPMTSRDLKDAFHTELKNLGKFIPALCKTPAARALVKHSALFQESKLSRSLKLTDLFLVKRDPEDPFLIREISGDELIETLISENNVWQYSGGQSGSLLRRSTEFYYNPYLCSVDIDPLTGETGPLDRLRLQTWRCLARLKGLRIFSLNARLPVAETQKILREFLENGGREVRG